jgi:succinyl-CoA:(S)-malate CoA-transferase subunit B
MLSESSLQALTGLKVIDISTFIAGPFCAVQLGEFGAEVIKLELPGGGDPLRKFGTLTECGDSLPWLSEARNKKSITLDLRKPEGAALFKRLIIDTDVLVENFQPGTLEKWGLGWESLKALNPRLVLLRISGYGQTGPYSHRPGFGRIGNAFGGLSYLAGFPDRQPVTPGSATLPDYLAGVFGAFGVMVALEALRKTGVGQVIDIGLYEPIFRILDELAPAFYRSGFMRERMGSGTVNVVPHNHYPTADGKWLAIACTNDKIFERLAHAMGQPELASPHRWGVVKHREAQRGEVDELVADWTQSKKRHEIIDICEQFQVPCGPVYRIDEIFEDPQYAARENILFFNDQRSGTQAIPNVVPRLSDTPGQVNSLGPALGAHNDEIYRDRLGLSETDLQQYRAAGVI